LQALVQRLDLGAGQPDTVLDKLLQHFHLALLERLDQLLAHRRSTGLGDQISDGGMQAGPRSIFSEQALG
jgi:hypothetical protein